MNETIKRFQEMAEYITDLEENNRVNGNFSDDAMIELFEHASDLEDAIESFRKPHLREKIRERANDSNEKGYLVLKGRGKRFELYQNSSRSVDKDQVKDAFKSILEKEDQEEAIDWLFNLIKSFYVGKTDDHLPSAISKWSPSKEDHAKGNYWNIKEED